MKTETITDIVNEMRNRFWYIQDAVTFGQYLNRIEAAHKRETIDDLVREIRKLSDELHNKERVEGCVILNVWSAFKQIADRIEAAAKAKKEVAK